MVRQDWRSTGRPTTDPRNQPCVWGGWLRRGVRVHFHLSHPARIACLLTLLSVHPFPPSRPLPSPPLSPSSSHAAAPLLHIHLFATKVSSPPTSPNGPKSIIAQLAQKQLIFLFGRNRKINSLLRANSVHSAHQCSVVQPAAQSHHSSESEETKRLIAGTCARHTAAAAAHSHSLTQQQQHTYSPTNHSPPITTKRRRQQQQQRATAEERGAQREEREHHKKGKPERAVKIRRHHSSQQSSSTANQSTTTFAPPAAEQQQSATEQQQTHHQHRSHHGAAAIGSAEQAQQHRTAAESLSPEVPSSFPEHHHRYSSPPRKVRRMHVGVITSGPASTISGAAVAAKSVGQRFKDATLGKEQHQFVAVSATNGSAVNGNGALFDHHRAFYVKQQPQQHHPVKLTNLQKNTVRVIGQYLRELGMAETVDSLVGESGCRIEDPLSVRLREYVQSGEWQKALEVVEKLRGQLADRQYITVRVLLLEERFKELIDQGELLLALRLLQLEYPKCKELRHRHEHWAMVLCSRDIDAGGAQSNSFCGDSAQVLGVLRKILPPSLMLPPNRLQELLKQSWLYQTKQCDLHVLSREQNVLDERAILVDHQCTSREFPARNTCTLYQHNAEVWCVKFSPCGRYLASGAKGNQLLIWRVNSPTNVQIYQNIQILQGVVGIASLSWSQDSRYLAVTSTEQANGVGCFIYFVPSGRLIKEYTHYAGDAFTTVSFFKDGTHKLACAGQRGHFHIYDIHRNEDNAKTFEGFRIRCLYACRDGRTVLASDTHNRIRSYDFETLHEQTIIQEASNIITFCVDRQERYCLVTTKTEGIRLWCLKTNALIRSFFGANHSEFVITSSFGGPDDSFIASGSEDNTVVVWNLRRSHPVKRLIGHTSTVNSVSWNPSDEGMIASGSDDGTIKIWSSGLSLRSDE